MENPQVTFLKHKDHPKEHEPRLLEPELAKIQNGEYAAEIDNLRQLLTLGDRDTYDLAKKELPSISYQGTFTPGTSLSKPNFEVTSGIAMVDLDKFESIEQMQAAKIAIIQCPNVIFCFISPSGIGLKIGVRYDTSKFNKEFYGFQVYDSITPLFVDAGLGPFLDTGGRDIRRICFVSHDPDLYYQPEAIPLLLPDYVPKVRPPKIASTASEEQIKELLSYLSPEDREDWLDGLMALHYADEGLLDVADEWSQTAGNYQGYDDIKDNWDSFDPEPANPKTIATLVHKAKLNGYEPKGRWWEGSVDSAAAFESAGAVGVGAENSHAPKALVTIQPAPKINALEVLKGLSATNRLVKMRSELLNDAFVFDGLALMGQITLFYAKANTGKTLLFMGMLIDAIIKGDIKAENVFYINADDSHKGLYEKACIAKENGFRMIGPGESGTTSPELRKMLTSIAESGDARGVIIVLDTLKKFANMMSKEDQKAFFEEMRALCVAGGTVILAGHTNKKFDPHEKEYLYEGTGDTINDPDCVYYMETVSESNDERVVRFVKKKDRGDMVQTASYKYTKRTGMAYAEMLDTVSRVTKDQVKDIIHGDKATALAEKYELEVNLVLLMLEQNGPMSQSAILKEAGEDKHTMSYSTVTRFRKILTNDTLDGISWNVHTDVANHNAKIYSIKEPEEPMNFL